MREAGGEGGRVTEGKRKSERKRDRERKTERERVRNWESKRGGETKTERERRRVRVIKLKQGRIGSKNVAEIKISGNSGIIILLKLLS